LNKELLGRLMPWLVMAVILLLWEGLCRAFHVAEFILPTPSRIIATTIEYWGAIWFHASHTLLTTLIGFALSVVFGLLLGIAVGSSRLVYQGLYPLLIGFNSIPKVAIVPVLVIWFGVGTVPAILVAFLMSFFPIAVNVATSLSTVEPELEDVLRSLGAGPMDLILKVGLPRSLPYFFASLKVAITLAFVGAVISESIASSRGIGTMMVQAAAEFRVALVFSGLAVTAAMGIVMYMIFAAIEGHTTQWATRKTQQEI
jgi:NitT/TauT family transport system permease protein